MKTVLKFCFVFLDLLFLNKFVQKINFIWEINIICEVYNFKNFLFPFMLLL